MPVNLIVGNDGGNNLDGTAGADLVGYGAGATFTNINATQWQVNCNSGASHEIIIAL